MTVELQTIDSGENKGTISAVLVDGIVCCWALELPWLNNEINISCVPSGTYKLKLEYSRKFGRSLYELKDVPGRSECKFHKANYLSELSGCIALGMDPRCCTNKQYIMMDSTPGFIKFMKAIGERTEDELIISGRPTL